MTTEAHNVLVAGAGQLGSRYLQGLAKCLLPLRIAVQDNSRDSLERARLRWNEVLGPKVIHDVSYHSSIETLPRQIEVAIVATTADARPQLVAQIASHADVRYWVLEKVLAQSKSGLDEIVSHVGPGTDAWVNTPRRLMAWHREIKAQLDLRRPMTMTVKGGAWGLACNAVHFLDLFAWWSGEVLQVVQTDRLAPRWFESKRLGAWEIAGTLEAMFSGGSCAVLTAGEGAEAPKIDVTDGHRSWFIDESAGLARRSDGLEVPGRLSFQSELTGDLVDALLGGRGCSLPSLGESAALHHVFVHSLLEHWIQDSNPGATAVPIT
jgi:hypothetical protein